VFISKALSPARVGAVYLEDGGLEMRNATVVVPDDQLSLAIGRDGQNARLAAKLTHWKIDIKSLSECTRESIKRIAEDPAYAHLQQVLESELKHATATIAKMEERRPIMPEEYAFLNKVVDATERLRLSMQKADRAEREARIAAVRATFPAAAYALTLEEIVELDDVLRATLLAAGFASAGTVLETLALDEDAILKLDGVGPKVISDLHDLLLATARAIPVAEPEPELELQPAAAEPEATAATEAVLATAPAAAPAAEVPVAVARPSPSVPERVFDKDEDPDDDGEGKGKLARAGAKKRKKDKGSRRGRTIIYDEDADTYITGRAAGLDEEDARIG
jgi:N utilization substance protein A